MSLLIRADTCKNRFLINFMQDFFEILQKYACCIMTSGKTEATIANSLKQQQGQWKYGDKFLLTFEHR